VRDRSSPSVMQHTIRVRTGDGVRLSGIAVPALPSGPAAVTFVVAHGFTHSVAREPFGRLVGWLRRFGDVRALDFRGHGASGGGSAVGGDPEVRDVDAAVRSARAAGARAVVTVGLSMGGGAALRQAATGEHRPDAVVSVSAVSRWYVRDTRPMQRVHWLLETTVGRRVVAGALGLRLDVPWATVPPAPVQLVSAIAPTPLLLVHGDRDEYFPLEHFRTLAQAAGPAATVWVVPGMGHAESGMTAPLAERIGRWAQEAVGVAPAGVPDGGDTTGPGSGVAPATSGTIGS
jgi:pimeloyl-ACP methyl ester carboxylesterase